MYNASSGLHARRGWIASALLVTGLMAASSSAEVLYDTTWMTDEQSYNHFLPSNIGAIDFNNLEFLVDVNAADDFVVPEGPAVNITSVTCDFFSNGSFEGAGVLVEFFADVDGSPANESPIAAHFATVSNGLTVTEFDETVFGAPQGLRFTIDLSEVDVSLDAGTWWVSIVPVDEALPSAPFRWLRTIGFQETNEVHVRNGGEAHANGLPGTWGTDDWTPISGFNDPGDFAFQIVGTADVNNPADLDGSGAVDVGDLLILLGNWGTDGTGADLEKPFDVVDVADLLVLLANWG